MGYQYFAFLSSPLFGNWDQSFLSLLVQQVLTIVQNNFDLTVPVIISLAVLGVLYLLLPAFCEGAMIQLIARKRNDQPVRTLDGIRYGMLNFLPLFEYSWFARSFSWVSAFTWSALFLRNLGWEALQFLLPIMIIFLIVSVIMTLIFTYTEFFIVIDGQRVIKSIGKSSTLVVTHLEHTLLLTVLMVIIGVRILVQLLFVLLIPAIMTGIVYFVAAGTLQVVALAIASVAGLVMLYIASYLSATIHVFAASVWTFTFLELTKEEEISPRQKPGEEPVVLKDDDEKDEA